MHIICYLAKQKNMRFDAYRPSYTPLRVVYGSWVIGTSVKFPTSPNVKERSVKTFIPQLFFTCVQSTEGFAHDFLLFDLLT